MTPNLPKFTEGKVHWPKGKTLKKLMDELRKMAPVGGEGLVETSGPGGTVLSLRADVLAALAGGVTAQVRVTFNVVEGVPHYSAAIVDPPDLAEGTLDVNDPNGPFMQIDLLLVAGRVAGIYIYGGS